jgi:hypothetical protein
VKSIPAGMQVRCADEATAQEIYPPQEDARKLERDSERRKAKGEKFPVGARADGTLIIHPRTCSRYRIP